MGLSPEPVSTQVIPRDRHAAFFAALGVVASSIERIATEIRHLQRTEVREAEEHFTEKQKGSSAMPHKRNPILTENLTGLARLVRSYALPAMENVALWHERDISHSSVERMIGPDATITLDFALARLTGVIEKLVVYPENMTGNLNRFEDLFNSQRILLALTQKGVSREDAYRLVQRNAMKVWLEGARFREALMADPEVSRRAERGGDPRKTWTSRITRGTWTRFSRGSSAADRRLPRPGESSIWLRLVHVNQSGDAFMRAFALFAALAAAGCGGGPAADIRAVALETAPAGARCVLFRDSAEIARFAETPQFMALPEGAEELLLTCSLEGHAEAAVALQTKPLSRGLTGRLFGGGALGYMVDLSTGKVAEFDDSILITMRPLGEPAKGG